jgi:hypothetical protein
VESVLSSIPLQKLLTTANSSSSSHSSPYWPDLKEMPTTTPPVESILQSIPLQKLLTTAHSSSSLISQLSLLAEFERDAHQTTASGMCPFINPPESAHNSSSTALSHLTPLDPIPFFVSHFFGGIWGLSGLTAYAFYVSM